MPKIKTHSGAKKRFSLTKSGKVKRAHAFKSHILTKKDSKRCRRLRSEAYADVTNEATIKKRFEVYHSQTAPLAAWFEQEGIRNTFTWKGSKEVMLGEIFSFLDSVK